jgi:hypothetical protein
MSPEMLACPDLGTMEAIIDAHRRASLSVMVNVGCPSDRRWCRVPPRAGVLLLLGSIADLGSAEDDGKGPPECAGHGATYFRRE